MPSNDDLIAPSGRVGRPLLRAVLAAIVALTVLYLVGWGTRPIDVVLDMKSRAGADGEIFYARAGEGHHPDRRVAFDINGDGQWRRYRVEVPEHRGLNRLRIDPGSGSGPVEIRRIAIESPGRSVVLSAQRLLDAVVSTNSMQTEANRGSHPRFAAAAPDPFVDFKLPDGSGASSLINRLTRWLSAALVAGLLWILLVEFAWPHVRRRLTHHLRIPAVIHRIAAGVSDPGVLTMPAHALAVVAVALSCAVVYIALNLHQSSVGVWEEVYPAAPVEQLVDLGTPKHVRSDEWNTWTPWILGQVAQGMPDRNTGIGGERAPLLASVPVAHSSAIAQAKFYGFYLFDSETGFSWYWAYKSFGLLLSFFWLFLLLTRGNVAGSALGSAWIYGSSFTQWWFSIYLPEILIAFALGSIGAIYLLFSHRRRMMGIGAALVAYSFLNLVLNLYPAYIVPLAYLGAAIVVGILIEPGRLASMKVQWRWRLLFFGAAAACVAVLLGDYLRDAVSSIHAMVGTSYPGRRSSTGGSFPLERLFYGFFEVFRIGEKRLPLPPTNATEASSFILLAPVMLFVMPLRAFVKRDNALLTALAVCCVFAGIWISFPLPRLAESAMQAMGWSWVPPPRAVLGLGIGSIIATTVLFSRVRDGMIDVRPRPARRMIAPAVLGYVLLFGWGLHGMDPTFFQPRLVLAASAVAALMAAGIALGRTGLFAAGVALAVAPALLVNPLVSGLSAIQDKPVLLAAKRQGGSIGSRWAVVGDFVFSQGLKAQGLDVLTGSQMIPNHQVAQIMDPASAYEEIWNRYAHIVLRSDPGRGSPTYELTLLDLYVISIDVCGRQLPQLGVTNVAYTGAVPAADLRCLAALDSPADSGVRLFRLNHRPSSHTP